MAHMRSSSGDGAEGFVEVKSKFDAEFRRFSLDKAKYKTFEEFQGLLEELHILHETRVPFLISYIDPRDNDLLPINKHRQLPEGPAERAAPAQARDPETGRAGAGDALRLQDRPGDHHQHALIHGQNAQAEQVRHLHLAAVRIQASLGHHRRGRRPGDLPEGQAAQAWVRQAPGLLHPRRHQRPGHAPGPRESSWHLHQPAGARRLGREHRPPGRQRRGPRSQRYRGGWQELGPGHRHDGGQQLQPDCHRETRQPEDSDGQEGFVLP